MVMPDPEALLLLRANPVIYTLSALTKSTLPVLLPLIIVVSLSSPINVSVLLILTFS